MTQDYARIFITINMAGLRAILHWGGPFFRHEHLSVLYRKKLSETRWERSFIFVFVESTEALSLATRHNSREITSRRTAAHRFRCRVMSLKFFVLFRSVTGRAGKVSDCLCQTWKITASWSFPTLSKPLILLDRLQLFSQTSPHQESAVPSGWTPCLPREQPVCSESSSSRNRIYHADLCCW